MKLYKYLKGGKLKLGELGREILDFIYQNDRFNDLPEEDNLDLLVKTYMASMYTAQCETILQCLQNLLNFSNNKEKGYQHGVIDFISKDRENYTSAHIRYWNILYIIIFDKEGIPLENINNIVEKTTQRIKDSNFNYLPEPILLNEEFIKNIIIPYLKKYENSVETIDTESDKIYDQLFIDKCNVYFINNFDLIKKYAEWWTDANASLNKASELHISKIKQESGHYVIDSYINNLSDTTLKKSLKIDRLILNNLISQLQIGGGFFDYFKFKTLDEKSPTISDSNKESARLILQNNDNEDKKKFLKEFQRSIDEKRSLTHREKEENNKKLQKLIDNMKIILLSHYKTFDESEDKIIDNFRKTTRVGGKNKKSKKKKTKNKKTKKYRKNKKTKKIR